MTFSIMIEVPERVNIEKRPRPVLVKFKTKEELDAYVAEEFRATKKALNKLAAATWMKNAREAAYVDLYHARKNFHDSFMKRGMPGTDRA